MNKEFRLIFEGFPDCSGLSAFEGLLRLFCPADELWGLTWSKFSGLNFDWNNALMYDVFGNVYFTNNIFVNILSLDSGDIVPLDVNVRELAAAVVSDPNSTIMFGKYAEAIKFLGRLKDNQNYAFKVELSLGGAFDVDNMYISDRLENVKNLAKIARQIRCVPIGAKFSADI